MSLPRTVAVAFALGTLILASACNRFGYDAHIESIEVGASDQYVDVRGWVHDPYLTKWGGCAVPVVRVDNVVQSTETGCDVTRGTGDRPDVEVVFGLTGYNVTSRITGLARGNHEVCIDVIPGSALGTKAETNAPAIECKRFDVPWDLFDNSLVEVAVVTGGILRAEGWYSAVPFLADPAKAQPAWIVDGEFVDTNGSGVSASTMARPDVVDAVGPHGKGYRLVAPVSPGQHRVCLGLRIDGLTGEFGGPARPAIIGSCRVVIAS